MYVRVLFVCGCVSACVIKIVFFFNAFDMDPNRPREKKYETIP